MEHEAFPVEYSSIKRCAKVLIGFFIVFMPFVIVLVVPKDIITTAMMAYLNCSLIMVFYYRWICKGSLAAMIPVLFLGYLAMAWPVSVLYFSIFAPENAYYSNFGITTSMFEGGVKIQLSVLIFLVGYALTVSPALRKEVKTYDLSAYKLKPFAILITVLGLLIIIFNGLVKVVAVGDFLTYVANGMYNYFWGLMFITGVFFHKFKVYFRCLVVIVLIGMLLFYTVGNARGLALFTSAMFVFGLLFFSGFSKKVKLILFISLLFLFPMYVVIGNTTRVLTGEIGFEDFTYRLGLLKEWQSVAEQQSSLQQTFGRLFYTGGHAVILRTPSEVDFRSFEIARFLGDMVKSLFPMGLFMDTHYRGTTVLLDYGFNIIPGENSVEVSLMGGLWLLGGWPAMFLGGIMIGLLHRWLMWLVKPRSTSPSPIKGYLYFSVFAPVLVWGTNWGAIDYWRATVYSVVFAFILYRIIIFFVGQPQQMQVHSEYPEYYDLN